MKLPKTKPRRQGTAPFAYDTDLENNQFVRNEAKYKVLKNVVEGIVAGSIKSIREGRLFFEAEGYSISVQSLSKYVKEERENTGARSKYNYHSTNKAKIKARQELRAKQDKVQKLQEQLQGAKKSLESKTKTLTKLDEDSNKETIAGKIVTDEDIESLSPTVQKAAKKEIIFEPNAGPQTEFLAAAETDVLYGGAAGGGKSYAMLVDPLRYCHRPAHRALILRRSMPELRELIDKSRELYPKAFPGCKFREVEKIWNFPSGAKLEFGFLERDADVYRYQGQAYSWIGFDEITHLNTEFSWNYLASRLRTTDPEITPYMRCTANPGGVGASWVKKRYVSPAEPSTSFVGDDGLTRRFIPARLEDNPYLAYDGRYEQMLNALPDVQRRQLLEGNWDVTEGAAFTEFDLDVHVIPPFEIPISWERVKGIDYGYASESACVWATVDPDDNTLIVYRELYRKGLTGEELAVMITNMELEDPYSVQGVLDTAAWNRTGTTGPTVGETLQKAGHKLRRADKNRIQGKIQIHEYLRVQPNGRPKLQISTSCPNLIRELQSIPLDKSNPEDVDTHAQDHAYDALRYLIMSRPKVNDIFSKFRNLRMEQAYTPADAEFGY